MIRSERGTALIEVLVLGTLLIALVLHAGIAAGRIQAAGELAAETAQMAAEAGARYATAADAAAIAKRLAPNAIVTAARTGNDMTVTVTIDVPLIGPEGGPVTQSVVGRATARISPYRSGNG